MRLSDGQAAFEAALPSLGAREAGQVGAMAARHSAKAAAIGVLGAVVHTAEAAKAALEVKQAEREGNVVRQAEATAKYAGAAGTALLTAGLMFGLSVFAVPALPVIVIGALVGIVAMTVWNVYLQKPAASYFSNYISGR
jgi:hypothetical protein